MATRISLKDLEKLYKNRPTTTDMASRGEQGGGFSRGEVAGIKMANYLLDKAKEEQLQSGRVDLRRMIEEGTTGRTKLTEAGQMERLLEEQRYGRPLQEAQTTAQRATAGYYGNLGEAARLEAAHERDMYPSELRELKRRGELSKIATPLAKARLRRQLLEEDKQYGELISRGAEPDTRLKSETSAVPKEPAATKRRINPALWEGYDTGLGVRLPGLGAPLYGLQNLGQWLGYLGKKGAERAYEWAYPPRR